MIQSIDSQTLQIRKLAILNLDKKPNQNSGKFRNNLLNFLQEHVYDWNQSWNTKSRTDFD